MDERPVYPISVVTTAVTATLSVAAVLTEETDDSLVCEVSPPSLIPSALRRRITHRLLRNTDGVFVLDKLLPATTYSVHVRHGGRDWDLDFTTQARLVGPQLVPHYSCATTLCVRWAEPIDLPAPKYSIRYRLGEKKKLFGEIPWETKILTREDLRAPTLDSLPGRHLQTPNSVISGLLQTPNSVISGYSPHSAISGFPSSVASEPPDDLDHASDRLLRPKGVKSSEETNVTASDRADVPLMALPRTRPHGLPSSLTGWSLGAGFAVSAASTASVHPSTVSGVHTSYTIQGLKPRIPYHVALAVHDPCDDVLGPWSETLGVETSRAAPLVVDLTMASVTHREVALTWMTDALETDDDVTEFIIDIHRISSNKEDRKVTQPVALCRDEARKRSLRPNLYCCILEIQPNSTYSMEVAAVTEAGTSEKPLKIMVTSMPLAPSVSLKVISSYHDAVVLAWQYPSNVDNLDYHLASAREQHIVRVRFRIGRALGGFFSSREWKEQDWIEDETSTDANLDAKKPANYRTSWREERKAFPTAYNLRGLDPETDYIFQIKVFTSIGESEWSDATSEIKTKSVAPSLDTTVTLAKALRQALLIQWDASSSSDVTSYMLRYKRSKQAVWEHYREIFAHPPPPPPESASLSMEACHESDASVEAQHGQIDPAEVPMKNEARASSVPRECRESRGGSKGSRASSVPRDCTMKAHTAPKEESSLEDYKARRSSNQHVRFSNSVLELCGASPQHTPRSAHSNPVESEVESEVAPIFAHIEGLQCECSYDFEVAARTQYGVGTYTKSITLSTIAVAPDVIRIDLVETRSTALRLRLTFPTEEKSDLVSSQFKELLEAGVNDDVCSLRVRLCIAEAPGYLKKFSFISGDRKSQWYDREIPFDPISRECEIDELAPSTTYLIQVGAQTPAGRGLMSADVRFSTWKASCNVQAPAVVWNSYNRCRILLQADTAVDAVSVPYKDDPIIGFDVWQGSKIGKQTQHRFETTSDMCVTLFELDPSTEYELKARSFSKTGAGFWSAAVPFMTLPVAPAVVEVRMLHANSDSLDVTWETVTLLATLPGDDEEPLSPDLEVVGCDLRWAEDAAGVFKSRPYCDPVRVDRVGFDDPFFRIENLKDAHMYKVQVRSVTSVGKSSWSAEYTFQTTVPTPPPSPPTLIMSTATQLTISFEVFGDEFEVFQVQMAQSDRLSEPFALGAVRRNGNHRVVTLQNLLPDTTYRMRIRGMTRKNTPSSWSEKGGPMRTRQGVVDHKQEDSLDLYKDPKDTPSSSQLRLEEESLGKKLHETIEPSLKFLVKVVLGGVEFPQGGNYPSVKEQAQILLLTYGTSEAAIDFCVKEAENKGDNSLHLLTGNIADFVIGCVPIAGFPAVFLKELGAKLRRCALIAELSGHDTENTDVLMLMFTCLVPQIGGSAAVAEETAQALDTNALVRGVSRAVVAEALILAAGVPSLRQVVLKGMDVLLGRGDDTPQASVESLATEVFRATPANEEVWFLVLCGVLWALPFTLSAFNFFIVRISPFLESKVSQGISLYVILLSLFIGWITAAPIILKYQEALKLLTRSDGIVEIVKIPAPIIFMLHAGLPCLSCFLGMRDVAVGFSALEHRSMILCGVYSLLLNYIRWCIELKGRAQLDETEVSAYGTYHPQAKLLAEMLWRCGMFFFFVEEFLGRFIGLHDIRLISGAASMLNFKTVHFALSLVGTRAQAHLLDSLQKRQVLLRILGAKRTVIGSMIILLTGVFAMVKYRETEKFFARITPNPTLCCAVVMIRRWGLIVGILLPTIWLLYYILPTPIDFVFTLVSSCALGSVVTTMTISEWNNNEDGYSGNFRVVFLFPETSAKVRHAYQKVLLTGTDMTVRKGAIVGSQAILRGMWSIVTSRFR